MIDKTEIKKIVLPQYPVGFVAKKQIFIALGICKTTYWYWLKKEILADPSLEEAYYRRGKNSRYIHVDDAVRAIRAFVKSDKVEIEFTD